MPPSARFAFTYVLRLPFLLTAIVWGIIVATFFFFLLIGSFMYDTYEVRSFSFSLRPSCTYEHTYEVRSFVFTVSLSLLVRDGGAVGGACCAPQKETEGEEWRWLPPARPAVTARI